MIIPNLDEKWRLGDVSIRRESSNKDWKWGMPKIKK